jgi:hypothetical protein
MAIPNKDEKVNCRVLNRANGGNHLVFTVDGTKKCVGEIAFTGDERYLLVIAEMFSKWADMRRGKLIVNGHSHQ